MSKDPIAELLERGQDRELLAKEICYAHYDHLGMLRPGWEDCAKGEQRNYLFFAHREADAIRARAEIIRVCIQALVRIVSACQEPEPHTAVVECALIANKARAKARAIAEGVLK